MVNSIRRMYSIVLLIILYAVQGVENNKEQIFSYTSVVKCVAQCLRIYSHFDCHYTSTEMLTLSSNNSICDSKIDNFFCECLGNVTLQEKNSYELIMNNENDNLKIHCRDINELVFKWTASTNESSGVSYILSLEDTLSNSTKIISTNATTYVFINLTSNTTYKIILWILKDELQLHGKVETSTREENNVLLPVSHMWTENLMLTPGKELFEVDVCWAPAQELSCYYEFILVSPNSGISDKLISQKELYRIHLNQLKFGGNYTVGISTADSDSNISERLWLSFFVPTCLEEKKNIKECPPNQPEDLQVEKSDCKNYHIFDKTCMFDVFIKWKKPEYQPDYYTIEINFSNQNDLSNVTSFMEQISGENTNFTFENVSLRATYEIKVTAFSEGGRSPFVSEVGTISKDVYSQHSEYISNVNKTIIVFVIILIILLIIVIVGIIVYAYEKKRKQNLCDQKYFKGSKKSNDVLSIFEVKNKCFTDDILEIPQNHLVLHSLLGQGAFGVVRRGFLITKQQDVAIKMLKDDATTDDIKQFKQEIEMMKSIEPHPNLVSMIGYCMADRLDHKIYLIVEYCSLGDLQEYLRNFWNQLRNTSLKTNDTCETLYYNICSNNVVFNLSYGTDVEKSKCDSKEHILTSVDLLSFSRQIALGMEYLSSNRVVHRDLAARNVLVTGDRTMKIADFGLSRDIYQENLYKKIGNGKLPIKWMALESLTHQLYTTQSDVWSFGILLWEIVTLGSSPYPSIPTSRLLKLLQSGYRMECPANCSSELYSLMISCWNACPTERPTFEELRSTLEVLLEAVTPDKYLSLDILGYEDEYHNNTSDSLRSSAESQDMYLKPQRCDL